MYLCRYERDKADSSGRKLPDQYTDESGPNKGWEHNIMGNSMNGTLDNRNITDILKTAWDEYDKWIKDGNKGEFKYEINP